MKNLDLLSDENIFEMKLHDYISINHVDKIIRVPGGWIYQFDESNTFIPYSDEFKQKKEVGELIAVICFDSKDFSKWFFKNRDRDKRYIAIIKESDANGFIFDDYHYTAESKKLLIFNALRLRVKVRMKDFKE